jgi:hypothetical protein
MVGFHGWVLSCCANATVGAATKIVAVTKNLNHIGRLRSQLWSSRLQRGPSPDLPVGSELFQREQVQHCSGFDASLAQSHNVPSHVWHQWVVRFGNTKCFACFGERCGHDSDLIRFESSSRQKWRNRHNTHPLFAVTPQTFIRRKWAKSCPMQGDDPRCFKKPDTCCVLATGCEKRLLEY